MNVLRFLLIFMFASCVTHKASVVDEASAVLISQSALSETMNSDELQDLQPFKAVLIDNGKIWQVYPRDIMEYSGLLPIVYISKNNGSVKNISWGKEIPQKAIDDYNLMKIAGKWTMCQKGYESHRITSNICTDILFFENGKGEIKAPGYLSNFYWALNGDTIRFSFSSESDKIQFISADTNFTFDISGDDKSNELKLKSVNSDSWYRLLKSK